MNVSCCFFVLVLVVGCGAAQPSIGSLPPLDANITSTLRIDLSDHGGQGSGTVISHDGHILTANHALVAAEELSITVADGGPYPFVYRPEVVAVDKERDLAVIKIARHFDQTVVLADPRDVHVGDEVYTAGYPVYRTEHASAFGQTVRRGSVIKRVAEDDIWIDTAVYRDAMLIDVVTAPGDSGGGVFSVRTGQEIGVEVAGFTVAVSRFHMDKIEVVVPVEQVRAFLDDNGIPYVSAR